MNSNLCTKFYICVCVCVINMIFFLHCKYVFISYEVFIFISYIEYLFMNNLCAWKAHIEILLWFSVESSGLINRLIFICLGSLAYSLCTTCLASCWRGCFTFVDLLLGVIKIVSQQVALNTTASRKSRKKNISEGGAFIISLWYLSEWTKEPQLYKKEGRRLERCDYNKQTLPCVCSSILGTKNVMFQNHRVTIAHWM